MQKACYVGTMPAGRLNPLKLSVITQVRMISECRCSLLCAFVFPRVSMSVCVRLFCVAVDVSVYSPSKKKYYKTKESKTNTKTQALRSKGPHTPKEGWTRGYLLSVHARRRTPRLEKKTTKNEENQPKQKQKVKEF